MEYHFLVVLASPALLCLSATAAAALWPRRGVVWALLLPAWILAGLDLGLLTMRHELAGPVLRWCRVDALGLVLASCAMPASALLLRTSASSRASRRLRATPWRFAAFQASMAGLGILPVPLLPVALWLAGEHDWRWRVAPRVLAASTVLAFLAWPRAGLVDLLAAGTTGFTALAVLPGSTARRITVAAAALLAVLHAWRALEHLTRLEGVLP